MFGSTVCEQNALNILVVGPCSSEKIEVWDYNAGTLRRDLEYQAKDELMLHDNPVPGKAGAASHMWYLQPLSFPPVMVCRAPLRLKPAEFRPCWVIKFEIKAKTSSSVHIIFMLFVICHVPGRNVFRLQNVHQRLIVDSCKSDLKSIREVIFSVV